MEDNQSDGEDGQVGGQEEEQGDNYNGNDSGSDDIANIYGIDPEIDPELHLALRMSYEAEVARQKEFKKQEEIAEAARKIKAARDRQKEKRVGDGYSVRPS
jgi:hypothetical protein